MRTAASLERRLSAVMAPVGITNQQFNVLRILRGAAPDPLPVLEIAERMIEEAPGITGLLDRLEAKGLVRRARCTEDRRQVHCWITDAGLALLGELDPVVDRLDSSFVEKLSDEDVRRLLAILSEIRKTNA